MQRRSTAKRSAQGVRRYLADHARDRPFMVSIGPPGPPVSAITSAAARPTLVLRIHRRDGSTLDVPMTCRLDTAEEVLIYEAGGVLQRFAQDFLESNTSRETEPA